MRGPGRGGDSRVVVGRCSDAIVDGLVDLGVGRFHGLGCQLLEVVAGAGEQVAVDPAAGEQLLVRALVDHVAPVHDDDAIGELERRAPVRDQDRGAPDEQAAQGLVDLGLDARVDRRGRVVEQQDAGIARAVRGRARCAAVVRPESVSPCSPTTVS